MIQRVLVAGLRGRQDVQVLDPLVLDQRLVQADAVVDDVDEVEHDPALAAHDQVEVAQADVEVDDDGLLAQQRQAGGDGGGGGRLADPALAGRDHDDSSQIPLLVPEQPPAPAGSGQRVNHQPLAFELDAGTSALVPAGRSPRSPGAPRRSTGARPRAGRRRSRRPRRPRCRRRRGRAGCRRHGCGRTAASSAPALTGAVHDEVAVGHDLLAAAHGLGDHPGRSPAWRRGRHGRAAWSGRRAAARPPGAAGCRRRTRRGRRRSPPRSTRACRSGCRPASAGAGADARPAGARSSGGWPASAPTSSTSGALRKKSGECAILSTSSGMKFGSSGASSRKDSTVCSEPRTWNGT